MKKVRATLRATTHAPSLTRIVPSKNLLLIERSIFKAFPCVRGWRRVLLFAYHASHCFCKVDVGVDVDDPVDELFEMNVVYLIRNVVDVVKLFVFLTITST